MAQGPRKEASGLPRFRLRALIRRVGRQWTPLDHSRASNPQSKQGAADSGRMFPGAGQPPADPAPPRHRAVMGGPGHGRAVAAAAAAFVELGAQRHSDHIMGEADHVRFSPRAARRAWPRWLRPSLAPFQRRTRPSASARTTMRPTGD